MFRAVGTIVRLIGLLIVLVVIFSLTHQNDKSQAPIAEPQQAVVVTAPEPPKPEPIKKAAPTKPHKSKYSGKYIWHELDDFEAGK
jgi:hypothetical protein